MPRIISRKEKGIVYACAILADALQLIFTPTVVGGDVVDIFIGSTLIAYGLKRKLFTPAKAMIFAATVAGEIVPFLNAAPFWTLDVMNLYKGTLAEAPLMEIEGGPLHQNGLRRPSGKVPPLNSGGARSPKKV